MICPLCDKELGRWKVGLKLHAGHEHHIYLGNYRKKTVKQMNEEMLWWNRTNKIVVKREEKIRMYTEWKESLEGTQEEERRIYEGNNNNTKK